jgi:Tfp pilus assembly protein PilF
MHAEAIGLFQRAMAMETTDASAYLNYGSLLQEQGQTEEAIAMMQRGLARGDTTRTALRLANNLGVLFYRKQDLQAAEEYFQMALRVRRPLPRLPPRPPALPFNRPHAASFRWIAGISRHTTASAS